MHSTRAYLLQSCRSNGCNDNSTFWSCPSSYLGCFKYCSIFILATSLFLLLLNITILLKIATVSLRYISIVGEFDNFFVFISVSSGNFVFTKRRSSVTGRISTLLNLLSNSVLNAIDNIFSNHTEEKSSLKNWRFFSIFLSFFLTATRRWSVAHFFRA